MTIITQNKEGNTTLLKSTVSFDQLIFASGVIWSQTATTQAAVVELAGFNQYLQVAGSFSSRCVGVLLSGDYAVVDIAATGQILSSAQAIYVGAANATITNRGAITAIDRPAIEVVADSGSLAVVNYGQITNSIVGGSLVDAVTNYGSVLGDLNLGGGSDLVRNEGILIGSVLLGSGADRLTNAGSIQGGVTFASLIGELPTLTNAGTVTGTVMGGAGSETIVNSGKITGDVFSGAGADRIVNSGEITGGIVTAGLLASAKANVLNTGHITGGITTGAAADTIDTHLGTVGGGLSGGRGNDTYVIAGTEQISEIGAATGGNDTVLSYGDYHLGIGLENLSLFGGAHLGIGNELANYLTANLTGSTLLGGRGDDFLFGEAGDDTLRGGGGSDTIYESDGQNTIYGGGGDDKVYLDGGDNAVSGGAGNDLFVAGDGVDYFSGDAGVDTVSYVNSTSGVTISLDTGLVGGGWAEGDQLYTIENLVGSASTDILTGSVANNRLDGGAGDDTLTGLDGDDVLTGGVGADLLIGGDGIDYADYSTATAAIVLNGATISGDIVGDSFNSIEGFVLSAFDDTFVAVYDLSLFIDGGAGNDRIIGKGAADRIDGDTGNDTLTGGGGADVFQFDRFFGANFQLFGWGSDTITDFQDGVDRIDLSHALGISAFSDLTITGTRSGTVIAYGSDSILLSGVASSTITAADFIFA